jgi:hypothetical protein
VVYRPSSTYKYKIVTTSTDDIKDSKLVIEHHMAIFESLGTSQVQLEKLDAHTNMHYADCVHLRHKNVQA